MPDIERPFSMQEFLHSEDVIDLIARDREMLSTLVSRLPFFVENTELTGDFVTVHFLVSDIPFVDAILGPESISRVFPLTLGLLDFANLNAAGIIRAQQQPYLDLTGSGTLIGFVDTGIDYQLDAFRYEDGRTKIEYIWDQSREEGPGPADFQYGTEYSREVINLALESETPLEIVPQQDTVGHGTFLASLAASRAPGVNAGAAPNAELIVVKLKKAKRVLREFFLVPPEQENVFQASDVMLGIEYMIRKAAELQKPIAICIAVGTNLGGHNGLNPFEEYLSAVSFRRGVIVSAAVGNESHTRHHTQVQVVPGGSQSVEIRVGDNASDIFLNIRSFASDRISVSCRSPTGEVVGRLPAVSGGSLDVSLVLERSRVIISYAFPVYESGDQQTIIKIIDPTPGIWTVELLGDIVIDGIVHFWLPITNFIRNVEFLTPTPNFTIVSPATSTGMVKVGAYNISNNSLYIDSSWGPSRLPLMLPDLVAPGVNVMGIYPGGAIGVMSGTSVAAAITTGASALMLEWGIVQQNNTNINTFLARGYFIRGCIREQGVIYPNTQWGYGKLDLYNTFQSLRQFPL